MNSKTYDAFKARFGKEQADAVIAAAESHKNGIHDNKGSDPFKWALCITIGYECLSKDIYRETHGITAPWTEIKQWIIDEADLGSHDGDIDYLTWYMYDEFFKK